MNRIALSVFCILGVSLALGDPHETVLMNQKPLRAATKTMPRWAEAQYYSDGEIKVFCSPDGLSILRHKQVKTIRGQSPVPERVYSSPELFRLSNGQIQRLSLSSVALKLALKGAMMGDIRPIGNGDWFETVPRPGDLEKLIPKRLLFNPLNGKVVEISERHGLQPGELLFPVGLGSSNGRYYLNIVAGETRGDGQYRPYVFVDLEKGTTQRLNHGIGVWWISPDGRYFMGTKDVLGARFFDNQGNPLYPPKGAAEMPIKNPEVSADGSLLSFTTGEWKKERLITLSTKDFSVVSEKAFQPGDPTYPVAQGAFELKFETNKPEFNGWALSDSRTKRKVISIQAAIGVIRSCPSLPGKLFTVEQTTDVEGNPQSTLTLFSPDKIATTYVYPARGGADEIIQNLWRANELTYFSAFANALNEKIDPEKIRNSLPGRRFERKDADVMAAAGNELGDPKFSVREKAGEKFLDMTFALLPEDFESYVVPKLEQLARSSNPEVARRAQSLIKNAQGAKRVSSEEFEKRVKALLPLLEPKNSIKKQALLKS